MPEFELVPVDGGNAIALPTGETVLGRGPFLGVNDKRVSRNHGVLENLNGQLRLKPTHLNPCFCQTSQDALPQPLPRDQWHPLQPGDIFSLLPGKYVYRIVAVGDNGTPRNSQAFEEEMEVAEPEPVPAEPSKETEVVAPGHSSTLSATLKASVEVEECVEDLTHTPSPHSHTPAPASFSKADSEIPALIRADESKSETQQRKRVLPAWMTKSATHCHSPSTSKGAGKRAPARAPTGQAKAPGPKQARAQTRALSSESDHSEIEETPRRGVRRIKGESEDESQKQENPPLPVSSAPARSLKDEVSEESDMGDVKRNGKKDEEREDQGRRGTATADDEAGISEHGIASARAPPGNGDKRSKVKGSEGSSGTSKGQVQRRNPCPYGSSCYRKNPVHFQESSHPGDSDYEEAVDDDGDEEDDDRPECPYGTDCYRKNPQHKREYKHTSPPASRSATRDEDDEDEDGYEDSFIDDESEGSEYVPDQSDDSGKEDIKQLKKEAASFIKKKRK